MTHLRTPRRRALLLLTAPALFGMSTALTGCSTEQSAVTWQDNGTPQHVHPNQDWWNYQYVYYPRAQIYFEPYTGVYSWYDGLEWQDSKRLPRGISLHGEWPRVVKNKSELPYYQHGTVAEEFRPQEEIIAGSADLQWSEESSQRYASHPSNQDH